MGADSIVTIPSDQKLFLLRQIRLPFARFTRFPIKNIKKINFINQTVQFSELTDIKMPISEEHLSKYCIEKKGTL